MGFNLRKLLVPNEVKLARVWQERAEEIVNAPMRAELARFEECTRSEPDGSRILLARARSVKDEPFWAGLTPEELFAGHGWVTGATGSGKSFLLLGLIIQVLRQSSTPLVVVDLKGELSGILIDLVLPALATTSKREELLQNLRIIRPFDETYLPMLRITQPEEGVPRDIQSYNLAASLAEALAEDLGARMNRVFLRMTALAIELDEPLIAIKRWLEDSQAFQADALRSGDVSLRAYATKVFPRESPSSIDALLARIDTFLFLRSTRLALSAPSCVSFAESLERGVTIIDLGNPPAGAERVARFWAGILVGRLSRAIMSRPVTLDTPQTWVIFEEFQEALAKAQSDQFGRLLALARFKKLSLWFCNQQAAQLSASDPTLVKLLRTNVNLMATFRCNIDDARTFAHALPLPDAKQDSEARNQLINEMTRLETRHFYLWLKQAPFRAQKVRSPRLDLEPLKERADGISDEVRERIRRGIAAISQDEMPSEEPAAVTVERPEETNPNIELEEFLSCLEDNDESNEPRLG